jgi:hypothetical protein
MMANGTDVPSREEVRLGARPGLSAFSASWHNLGQTHERMYADEKRTQTKPCLYLMGLLADYRLSSSPETMREEPSGESKWTEKTAPAAPIETAAAAAARSRAPLEAAGSEFRSWSVWGAETVEEDGGQKWEHQHGLMFEPLWLLETCPRCRKMSRMPHAEVALLAAVLVTLELVVELAEVSVAQRHTHLVASGRST